MANAGLHVQATPILESPTQRSYIVASSPYLSPYGVVVQKKYYSSSIDDFNSILDPIDTTVVKRVLITTPSIKYGSDNYHMQQFNNWLYSRIMDKWLSTKYMKNILKYLKVDKHDSIEIIDSKKELSKNHSGANNKHILRKKKEYIKDYLFDKEDLRKIIANVIEQTRIKWYNIDEDPKIEKQVVYLVNKFIEEKMKKYVD